MTSQETIPVTVNLAHVGKGGNTHDGAYFYSCVPKIINVTKQDTLIQFTLSEDSATRFTLDQIFCTDSFDQISPPNITLGGKTLEVTHANKVQSLIYFSLIATDAKGRGGAVTINIDPQATNVPT